jgi:hypothetical protein
MMINRPARSAGVRCGSTRFVHQAVLIHDPHYREQHRGFDHAERCQVRQHPVQLGDGEHEPKSKNSSTKVTRPFSSPPRGRSRVERVPKVMRNSEWQEAQFKSGRQRK